MVSRPKRKLDQLERHLEAAGKLMKEMDLLLFAPDAVVIGCESLKATGFGGRLAQDAPILRLVTFPCEGGDPW